MPPFY